MSENDLRRKDDLRKKAEAKLKAKPEAKYETLNEHYADAQALIHDLQVHQIELEMQNEELLRTQGELEKSKSRYFELYDLAPVGYLTVFEKGLIFEANLTVANLWGVGKSDLVGLPFTNFVSPEFQDTYYKHRRKLFSTKELQTCEIQMLKKSGVIFWARIEGSFATDKTHKDPVCRVVVSDISELKKSEQEKAIMQKRLFHSDKLASIGLLAAGVAHEINNPLAIISGFAEILKESCSDICNRHNHFSIEEIQRASEQIATIVKGLGTYAIPNSERIEKVDVHLCIKDTLALVQNIYKKLNITIDANMIAPRYFIKANAGKIQQVLLNILVNAKDALAGNQNGVINVATQNVDGTIQIEISDNGIGMSPDQLPKIFDYFFTTKEPGSGTGLGLSICHTIIESFGGTISALSEKGKGSTFQIRFPLYLNEILI